VVVNVIYHDPMNLLVMVQFGAIARCVGALPKADSGKRKKSRKHTFFDDMA
jgi:hypothetical protein